LYPAHTTVSPIYSHSGFPSSDRLPVRQPPLEKT
jgi:hypothetical protein